MPVIDHPPVAGGEKLAAAAEGARAGVPHEHAGGRDMAPAAAPRPQAKVVLLAIALAETALVELAHLLEAAAAHVQAETHPHRNVEGTGAELTLEKEPDFGKHQSTHNSGVLHAGLYYKPGSVKARMAVQGIRIMTEFCCRHRILRTRSAGSSWLPLTSPSCLA